MHRVVEEHVNVSLYESPTEIIRKSNLLASFAKENLVIGVAQGAIKALVRFFEEVVGFLGETL